jgi:hypothetical protein
MTLHAVARRLVELHDGEITQADDHRVLVVADALSRCRWRGLTAAGLAGEATAALDLWQTSLRRLDGELTRLLDAGA